MNRFRGLVFRILRVVVLVYVGILALAYLLQRRLQYVPDSSPVSVPADRRYRHLQQVTLTAEDGIELQAWYWPGTRPLTLLVFHGNAGNRRHRLDWMQRLHDRGWGVFMLDYRGYGGSGGTPSESGFARDAMAAWKWLRTHTDDALVLVGESIGTGVAVDLATRTDPAAMILQSPFASAAEVGQASFPFLPIDWLLKDRFDNLSKIKQVGCPLLFIHGEQDTMIPISHARRLFQHADSPKHWYPVRDAGHNDLMPVGATEYLDTIDQFLAALPARQERT